MVRALLFAEPEDVLLQYRKRHGSASEHGIMKLANVESLPRLVVVEIKFAKRLAKPVTLADVKSRKEFADFALVRVPRLSVMPVTDAQWKALLKI